MHPHHARWLAGSIIGLVLGLLVAGGGFWAYEYFWARFKPTLITKDQPALQALLDQGDWVSPGRKGAPIWMVTYRACDACTTYQAKEFPKLAAANVDTRVLVFARPDQAGQSMSTPTERSTVAEIWINRSWDLYTRWTAAPEDSWAPEGLRSADGDWARSAVVTATNAYVQRLRTILRENGLNGEDPILIWRDKKGRLKACSCTDRLSYHFVRTDFGAPDMAPPEAIPATAPANSAPASGAPAAASSAPPASSSAPAASSAPPAAAPAASSAPAASGATQSSQPPAARPAPRSGAASSNATFY